MAKREYIIAPAGHGKTEKISNFVFTNPTKRVLVLTHTNAGINTLIKRFRKYEISSSKYDISTIDSFSIKYAMAYSSLSGINNNPTTNPEYDLCRRGVIRVFDLAFLQSFLQARYSLIVIDEYQDCTDIQHEFILKLSENVDCIALGDPMQGIFNFGGNNLVGWQDIRSNYDQHETRLETPYRWSNGNEALGRWLSDARNKLQNGEELVFEGENIQFFECSLFNEKISPVYRCINSTKELLFVVKDDSTTGAMKKKFARTFNGLLQVVDALDFSLFYKFLANVESDEDKTVFNALITFFENCMTQVNHFKNPIENKIKKLWDGTNPLSISDIRNKAFAIRDDVKKRKMSKLYSYFLNVIESKGLERAKALLQLMKAIEKFIKIYDSSSKGFIYRKDIWDSTRNALTLYIRNYEESESLEDFGRKIRQQISFMGRGFKIVIGTTLLTKGLEFDQVIINSPEEFEAKHLYVALSRAKSRITILGKTNRVQLSVPENL